MIFPFGSASIVARLSGDSASKSTTIDPLSRVNTAAPSGARTPTSGPSRHVTIHKELGTGGFGVVYHVWNVSTGEEYALKELKKGPGHDTP